MDLARTAFLDLRQRSLPRANLLVLVSFLGSAVLSDFPHNRPTLWLIVPTLLSLAGTADTVRCIQKRWSLYHGGVLFCIYMDLMAVSMILFFLIYPYTRLLSSTR